MAPPLLWPLMLLVPALLLPGGARGGPWSPATALCPTVVTAATTSSGRARRLLLTFAWQRPDSSPPALVQSAWDPRGRLLSCVWSDQEGLAGAYLQTCGAGDTSQGPGRPANRAWTPRRLRRELAVLGRRLPTCQRLGGGANAEEALREGQRRRVRRGWTMPGTLWCGAGDQAENFGELGVFQGPDICCREHDQCEAQISALGYKYGMRNYRLHTISHCDCDTRFRQCLMSLNDTISNVVGVSFFNLLEIPCFVLEEEDDCLEWTWWGGCKEYGPVPFARLVAQSHYHSNLPLNGKSSPHVTTHKSGKRRGKGHKKDRKHKKKEKHLGQKAEEGPQLDLEHFEAQTSDTPPVLVSTVNPVEHSHLPNGPWTTNVFSTPVPRLVEIISPHVPTLGSGLLKTGILVPTELPQVQQSHTTGAGLPAEKSPSTSSQPWLTTTLSNLVPSQSCSCYRRLDRCPYRIEPGEVKYQLHNMDSRTLFHCNCTRRLARFLRKTKGPNEVEGEVLSDYVSPSCFILQAPPGCMEGETEQPNCIDIGRAILTRARHLTNRLTRKVSGVRLKVKRQDRIPLDRPLRLVHKCRQLVKAARHRAAPH